MRNIRPVPSMQPYGLLAELQRQGFTPRVVGSAMSGSPARDLDILIEPTVDTIDEVRSVLAAIGLGRWERSLNSLSRLPDKSVVTIETIHGHLDLHLESP